MKNINNQEKNQIPLQLFHQGTNPYAYEFLGVHKTITDGAQGMVCRVWAPNAVSASIVGDFNEWNSSAHPMEKSVTVYGNVRCRLNLLSLKLTSF